VGISSCKAGSQPRPSCLAELLCRGQKQLADAVQRVMLAAPMPEGGLLHPSAALVDHHLGSRMAGKWSTTTLRPRVETGGGSLARFGRRARPGGDPAERLKNRRRASGGVFWLPWDFAPRKELGSQRLSGSNAAPSPKQRKLIWA
jgi:hypothetical protein